jgi:hypothetical protein
MRIECTNYVVWANFDSEVPSVVDFVPNVKSSREAKIKLNAFIKLLVDSFGHFELPGFQLLNKHHYERLIKFIVIVIIRVLPILLPSLFILLFVSFILRMMAE